MSKSDSEREQREHNDGQESGAHGNLIGQLIWDLTPIGWIGDTFMKSDEFKKGEENGKNNRPK